MSKKTSKTAEASTQTPSDATETETPTAEPQAQSEATPVQTTPPAAPSQTADSQQPTAGRKPVYDFSHGKRCPRCQAPDTVARSTQGRLQYRRCQRAICKHTYTVVGRTI